MTFGQSIRKQRESLGLNQAELADSLGTTQGNLSRWERDLTEPREIETYRTVAEFLEISLTDLAGLIAETARQRALREIARLQD
jgi:transcriptional regulator with XRE-family HTH domain